MIDQYVHDLDVFGDGIGVGDFIPWMNLISKAAGGLMAPSGGADQKVAIEKARKEEQDRAKAAAEAAKTRTILYVTLGSVGVLTIGGLLYAVLKK